MILKKILLLISTFFILFSFSYTPAVANTGDITSSDFQIKVGSITPTTVGDADKTVVGKDSEETVNKFLNNIITKLITAFGVLSLLVMTIGAGFMIIYHGQDELLTRGKSIFSYGLISLVVALSAGFLVKLTSLLLYGA